MKKATNRAIIITSIFVIEGLMSLLYLHGAYTALVIFYAVLCFNTFFSIKLFDSLGFTNNTNQRIVDAALFFIYTDLAFSLNQPEKAMVLVVALFLIATYKYTHLLNLSTHNKLLRRKISVDNGGSLISFMICIGVILKHDYSLLWYWAVIFIVANIYLFTISPLYKID